MDTELASGREPEETEINLEQSGRGEELKGTVRGSEACGPMQRGCSPPMGPTSSTDTLFLSPLFHDSRRTI